MMTTPTVIASINSALSAAGAALVANQLTGSTPALVGVSATVFLASWFLHFFAQLRPVSRFRRDYVPRFPSEQTDEL